MHAKPYPEAKRRILIERDVGDFVAFLNEVTDSQGKTFIRNQLLQRSVNGFQPGHAPPNITVPILISKLRREQELTNPDSPIWDMFNNAWRCWVSSHQELNDILLEFDNNADFDENQQSIVPPNSELDRQCFVVLLEASRNNQINQETIRRFYEYGHFNEDEQIEELIDSALPKEEIERKQQIEQLPEHVERLHQEIEELRTQISNLDPISELQQELDQRIAEVQQSFENQLAQINVSENVSQLKQLIESLKSQIGEVDTSLKTRLDKLEKLQVETDSGIDEFVNLTERESTLLKQQIQNINQSVEERLDSMNSAIANIKSMVEEQNQPSNTLVNASETLEIAEREEATPRIAHHALRIGKFAAAKLEEDREHYQDENDYLLTFQDYLNRFGVTDSNETAAALHVALKAFPALETDDTRIFKIWNVICDKHFFYTRLFVEMGWLGFQDWFPCLLADECFGERLERIDLEISIQKMLEMGNMLWAIHFKNCDRSFPECYLPPFIQWIKGFSEVHNQSFSHSLFRNKSL